MDETDFEKCLEFYPCNLEQEYFKKIRGRFSEDHELGAFDFFCIVIWKSNRAKTKLAKSLTANGKNLEAAVRELTRRLHDVKPGDEKPTAEEVKVLLKQGGIGIPMASAILAILYPLRFTVYDYRVAEHEALKDFKNIDGKSDQAVQKYLDYVNKVKELFPTKELKKIDEFLWGKSFYEQLNKEIKQWSSKSEN